MRDAADGCSEIAAAAQLACLLEASAPKPGNVSPGRHFADVRYEDFLVSAIAIGEPLAGAGKRPVGATVRLAVEATARWTSTNTNLGIVLLLTPLARAAIVTRGVGQTPDPFFSSTRQLRNYPSRNQLREMRAARPSPNDSQIQGTPDPSSERLRRGLRDVLEATTVDDAREVYAAIRCASPGGLGRVATQDVADEPTATLLDVMRLAAGRDGIAREYATGFAVIFETAVPALAQARHDGLSWDDAIVETFLTLLAANPDTHVARRGGADLAVDVSRRASAVIEQGGVRSDAGRRAIDQLDLTLRDARHLGNPGTTADLTAAATFLVLLHGGWQAPVLPRDR